MLIRDFLRLNYWRRVWIFQELALGRNVVLVCGNTSLPLESVLTLLAWIKSIASKECPSFFSQNIWKSAIQNWNYWPWSRIDKLVDARRLVPLLAMAKQVNDAELNANPECRQSLELVGWRMAISSVLWVATDPKDYVYGLLGLTALDITPDYSHEKSVQKVSWQFFMGWLRYAERTNAVGTIEEEPLYLLSYAGIGLLGTAMHPSWLPDFARVSEGQITRPATTSRLNITLNLNSLSSHDGTCIVQGSTLFIPGVAVDRLTVLGPLLSNLTQEVADYTFDFVARNSVDNSTYPSTVLPIYRILWRLP